jgi:hypothetical protein
VSTFLYKRYIVLVNICVSRLLVVKLQLLLAFLPNRRETTATISVSSKRYKAIVGIDVSAQVLQGYGLC